MAPSTPAEALPLRPLLSRPASPLSSAPASAYDTPASLLTPSEAPPHSPFDAAAAAAVLPSAQAPPPAKPRRNVQWNELVSAHVTIPFFSEAAPDADSTEDGHGDAGGEEGKDGAASTRSASARQGERDDRDPFSDRWRLDDVPLSLTGGQDDGALDGLVAPVVKRLEVWVDPLERDGLPSAAAIEGGEGAPNSNESEDKAQGLVSAYAKGAVGLWEGLRQRRASISALRQREEDEDEKGTRPEDELHSPGADDAAPALDVAPGILSALIALQQQEAALAGHGGDSASSSTVPTPVPSTPSSPSLRPLSTSSPIADALELDSSDDEVERERFIAKLRAKRASKNALHTASNTVASASKHAAGAALRFAVGKGGERGRQPGSSSRPRSLNDRSGSHSRASSPTASSPALSPARRPASLASSASGADSRAPSSPALSAQHRTRSAASLVQLKSDAASSEPAADLSTHHRSHSHNALSRLLSHPSSRASASPPASPASPSLASPASPTVPVGVAVPHKPKLTSELNKRMRKVGDRLGLEWETSRTRPNAASSGAGVFGGLMLGAVRLSRHYLSRSFTPDSSCAPCRRLSLDPLPHPARRLLLCRPAPAITCLAILPPTCTRPSERLPSRPLPASHPRVAPSPRHRLTGSRRLIRRHRRSKRRRPRAARA